MLFYTKVNRISCNKTEKVPPRDKHGSGIAERSVGIMEECTNADMLAPEPKVPQAFWTDAMAYAATTQNFIFHKTINTSPYKYETGNDIDLAKLHGFWDSSWVLIDPTLRDTKVGAPRAEKAKFMGYWMTTVQFDSYFFVTITANGKTSRIGMSKDILFDSNMILNVYVPDEEPFDREFADPNSYVPARFCKSAPIPLRTAEVQIHLRLSSIVIGYYGRLSLSIMRVSNLDLILRLSKTAKYNFLLMMKIPTLLPSSFVLQYDYGLSLLPCILSSLSSVSTYSASKSLKSSSSS